MEMNFLMCGLMFFSGFMIVQAADFSKQIAEVKAGTCHEARTEWWGFNEQDSTAALQSAFDSGVKKVFISKQKGPWIVSRSLIIPSNIEVIFEDGAEIKAMTGQFKGVTDMLMKIRDRNHVTLRGKGVLTMNRKDYCNKNLYKISQWRHALEIFNSSDVVIDGLTMRESGGDGIYLNAGKNITINQVICTDNYRQGISVVSGENIIIKNSDFCNTSGTNPQDGIDFEPNHWKETIVNCVVENCRFLNNSGSGVEVMVQALNHNSPPLSITLRNCLIQSNRKGVVFINYRVPSVKGTIKFENCRIEGSRDGSFVSSGQTAEGYAVTLKDCVIDNSVSQDTGAIRLVGGYVSGAIGNLHCDGVEVIDPRKDAEPFAFRDWGLYPLANLSGSIKQAGRADFELSAAVKQSKQYKPFAMAKLNGPQSAPISNEAVLTTEPTPWRLRFSGIFVQYASAGMDVKIEAILEEIGRNNAGAEVTVLSPSGKNIGVWKVGYAEKKAVIEFKAAETGLYRLYYLTNFQGLYLKSALPGNGYLANSPVHCNHSKGRMYFLVPAGVADVAVKVSGDSHAEFVSVILRDSAGNAVVSQGKVTEPMLLHHRRTAAGADEAWSVEVTDSVDDFNITILGDAVPVFSDSPDKLIKTKAVK